MASIKFVEAQSLGSLIQNNVSLEEIKDALSADKEGLNQKDDGGYTPLHWAIKTNRADVLDLLLANKADLNTENDRKNTPLLLALSFGRKEMAKKILNVKDGDGNTVAKLSHTNEWGSNALLWASKRGYEDITELILQDKSLKLSDINVQNKWGSSPLTWAARKGTETQVSQLVIKGADINLPHKSSKKALDFAKEEKKAPVVFFLDEFQKALPKFCDGVKETPPETLRFVVDSILTKLGEVKDKMGEGGGKGLFDYNPTESPCLVAGWPGTFQGEDCVPLHGPAVAKWEKEWCQATEFLCNPALFGPKICISKGDVKKEDKNKNPNNLCQEKSEKDKAIIPKIIGFMKEKKNQDFDLSFDQLFEHLQLIEGVGAFLDEDDPLKDKKNLYNSQYSSSLKDWSFMIDDARNLHDSVVKVEDPLGTLGKASEDLNKYFSLWGSKDPSTFPLLGEHPDSHHDETGPGGPGKTKMPDKSTLQEKDLADLLDGTKDLTPHLDHLFLLFKNKGIQDETMKKKVYCVLKKSFLESMASADMKYLELFPDLINLSPFPPPKDGMEDVDECG